MTFIRGSAVYQQISLTCRPIESSCRSKKSASVNGVKWPGSENVIYMASAIFWDLLGLMASDGWQEAWRPHTKVQPWTFSGYRQGRKVPNNTSWWYVHLVCCLLGVSRSAESEFLSCLILGFSRACLLYVAVFY